MKKITFLLSLFIGIIFLSSAQTTIPDGSNISGLWTPANNPYIIEGEAIIQAGETLTISPGVIVEFQTGTNFDYSDPNFDAGIIIVEGNLIAGGSADYPVTFTRNGNSGNWGQIFFNSSQGNIFSYCNFEYGYRITNIESLMFSHGVLTFLSSFANIANCNFSNNAKACIACYESLVNFSTNNLINNNSGIYSQQADSSNFANNFIYDNTEYGIFCSDEDTHSNYANNLIYNSGFSGIFCGDNSRSNFANNTIVNNAEYGLFVDNANPNLTNMIFWNNADGAISAIGGNIDITHSLFQGTSGDLPAQVNYQLCIFDDPLFVNSASNNYQLQITSPCINEGTPDTTHLHIPVIDLAGNPRIYEDPSVEHDIIDMGAYENQGTTDISELDGSHFRLSNYPNPFTSQTIISFDIPKNQNAKLIIYDLKGNSIKECDISNKKQITWKPENLKSGLYFCEIIIGNIIGTRTLIYIK